MITFFSAYFFTAPEQLAGYPVLGTVDYLLTNIDRAAEALQLVNRDGGISTLCDLADGFQRAVSYLGASLIPYNMTRISYFIDNIIWGVITHPCHASMAV